MISIYTLTLGRYKYLNDCMAASENAMFQTTIQIEHVVCFQGSFSKEARPAFNGVRHKVWDKNYGIAQGMNMILPELKGDIIIKMDEDCIIRSPNFYSHVAEISSLIPDAVFSPYPVGLIRNPGGVPANGKHRVVYSEKLDTYYTLRPVDHVGGFCRVSPGFTKDWRFQPDLGIPGASGNEDAQFSGRCKQERIPMYYLENAIIVEHQESTLGQHERYKEYFNGRF